MSHTIFTNLSNIQRMTSRQHQKRFVCSISILYLALYLQPLLDRNKEWDFVKIWDDEENFLLNPAIQGISWEQVKEMVLLKKINVYEPIGWIIKAIVIHYYGMNSWAIRVVTVSFHVAACFLLILNSSKLLRLLDTIDARGSKNNNYLLGCIMSGLLYTIHPLIIEVVAWPSAQPYAVAMFFSMLSMYFNLYVHDHGAKMGLLQEMGYNFLSSFFYLCAVLSKSVSILLPSAVFLLDTVLLWTSNGNWKACIETIRKCTNRQVLAYGFTRGLYLVVLGIFLFITLDTNAAGTHIDADVHFLTLAERLTNFFMLPMWMFQHFMWPIGLRPHYQIHSGDLDLFTNSTSLLSFGYFLVLLGASIYLWYQESPKHFAALLYFLIMLFPTSGIIQHGLVSFTSDRYFYFPGILVVPYLGYFFHQIFEPTLAHQDIHSTMDSSITSSQKPKLNKTKKVQSIPSDTVATTSKTHPCPSYVTKFPIYLFLSVMLIISRRQVNIWVDSYSLLEHSVRLDTSDWRMLAYMGDHLYTHHGSNHEKLSHYWEQAFHFTPSYTLKGRLHRAKLYLNLFGLNDKLCEEYFLLHRQHPTSCHVLNNIAICYVKEKDYQKAREYFVQATEAKGYEHFYKIPKRNLEKFDQWDRSQGFEGSLMY